MRTDNAPWAPEVHDVPGATDTDGNIVTDGDTSVAVDLLSELGITPVHYKHVRGYY